MLDCAIAIATVAIAMVAIAMGAIAIARTIPEHVEMIQMLLLSGALDLVWGWIFHFDNFS